MSKSKSTTLLTLTYYWQYTRRYKLMFWTGTIGVVFGVIFQDIIPPFVVSRAFAHMQAAYASHSALTMGEMAPYLFGFIGSLLIGLVSWRIQCYMVWLYEIRATRDIITSIFTHLEQMGQKFHADRFGGALVSQTNKFVSSYEKFMDEITWSIVPGVTALIASSTVLFIVSYKFAFVLLGVVAIYIAVMSWRTRVQFPYNRREAETESERTAALADAITNIGTIRAFAHENYEQKRFKKAADATYKAYHKLAIETMKNDAISHTMTNSLRTVAFLFGVVAVTNWHANVSVLYLVITYASGIVDRLWIFGRVVRNINRCFGDSAEMTEILQLKPEIAEPKNPEPSRISRGAIHFKNVSFGHGANNRLFKSLDLSIKPGEKIGLVGPSGGGKTTLSSLLLRFMDINDGEICIDGQNITKITQADLRQNIAYVPQEPMLFHRTIRDNIRYGEIDASTQAVEAVAKMAHAHDFIANLSHGYDTLVGERGIKLSGGQRQRVAIARAMLKNAPILILDEATSALDSESEVLIQDALWKLMEGRTAIVIAHRLSTIQKMDRILVLEKGVIVEQGSHQELLNKQGLYAKLWSHQSGGFIEE